METTYKIPNYSGYAWAGYNFDRSMNTTEIAKALRTTINKKFSRRAGYRISVRRQIYAGGSSIDIRVKAAPFKIHNEEYAKLHALGDWEAIQDATNKCIMLQRCRNETPDRRAFELTLNTRNLLDFLTALGNSYRRDDSDSQVDYFDTNFYLHVGIDWETSKEA